MDQRRPLLNRSRLSRLLARLSERALVAVAIVVAAAAVTAHAAENSALPSGQDANSSRGRMTAAEKARALNEYLRRDAAGEKIDPALLNAFVRAQNEAATS